MTAASDPYPDCCWACVLDECPHGPHPADPEHGGKPCQCECVKGET